MSSRSEGDAGRGQVSRSAADVYEEFFVPALFREWTDPVADRAAVARGDRVLDVACGTGVLARTLVRYVGREGDVVGVDPNEGMLEVARRTAPEVEWRRGVAEDLPFEDESFDAVVSQFGLMFFDDRAAALREMKRVLRPAGRLAVAVWDTLDRTPGYRAMVELLREEFGDRPADALSAPYDLGDRTRLLALLEEAAWGDARIETLDGEARFESLETWIHTDVYGWTLSDMLDEDQYERLRAAARPRLRRFVQPDGRVRFDAPAHLITGVKKAD